jgi:hypothetical protein
MSRIDRYNRAIKAAARRHKKQVRVIDTGRFINDLFLGRDEVTVDGKVLSRKWVRGSGFSLDGVHPGYTGQALVANQVLEQVNKRLKLQAPLYHLSSTLKSDPYVDQDGDGWAPGPAYKASGLTKILFLFKDPDDQDATVETVLPANFWDQFSDAIFQLILGIPEIQSEATRMGVVSRDR